MSEPLVGSLNRGNAARIPASWEIWKARTASGARSGSGATMSQPLSSGGDRLWAKESQPQIAKERDRPE